MRIEAPVNGGRNYNGPSKRNSLSCSDPHERRNDLGTVSTRDSVKFSALKYLRLPATDLKDPMELLLQFDIECLYHMYSDR